jgi:Icc-related predicted phosphoesterase
MARTRIFFTTDVHGSTKVFIKFLNTPKVYNAKVIIMGGDLCGKSIIPIFRVRDNLWEAAFLGKTQVINNHNALEKLKEKIADVGAYYYVTTREEWSDLKEDQVKLKEIMKLLMRKRTKEWMNLCEERLGGKDVKVFISPGNDDPYEIDDILKSTYENIITGDERIENIDGKHQLFIFGKSNKTPWNCPRDLEESELSQKIQNFVEEIEEHNTFIFAIHVPPICSGLDAAPKLDKNLRPIMGPGGSPVMYHCGSTAVREAIEKYQPMASLHGHIHESRGVYQIGRTLCFNPGSEYAEGILRGVLLEIENGRVRDYLFTQG